MNIFQTILRSFLVLFGWLLKLIAILLLFWLVILKILSRLAVRFGISAPCPASFSWIVDNPIRRRYMRPILPRVDIQPGEQVLELGPGPGLFTSDAAIAAGPDGSIVAVDIQPRMIDALCQRLRMDGITNVDAVVASAHDLPLKDRSLDRAFLVTVLPEIPNQTRALAELLRVLKPEGVLSITEEFLDPDYPFAFETVRRVQDAGFVFDAQFGNPWLYTANFKRP
jgi:SAM-dependent methyltransferase